jgi:hypothetical protein
MGIFDLGRARCWTCLCLIGVRFSLNNYIMFFLSGFGRWYVGDLCCCVIYLFTWGVCGFGNIYDFCCGLPSLYSVRILFFLAIVSNLNREIDNKLKEKENLILLMSKPFNNR